MNIQDLVIYESPNGRHWLRWYNGYEWFDVRIVREDPLLQQKLDASTEQRQAEGKES